MEAVFLFLILSFKYFSAYSLQQYFSRETLNYFFSSFNLFYPGNLFWIIIFILSFISITHLIFVRTKTSSIGLILIYILISFVLFSIAVLIHDTPFFDESKNRIIQLNSKGIKVLILGLLTTLKTFTSISLCVISFSALKKYYFFRSLWLTLFVCSVFYFTSFLITSNYSDDSSKKDLNSDAGILLGAAVWGGNRPSPVLRERINKSAELLKNKNIKQIVLTGGGSPGEMTEAEVSKNELVKKGIDEKIIITENQSNSTLEQIYFVKQNLYHKRNWSNIILISDRFHLYRASQIASFYNMKSYTIASDTPLSTESEFNFNIKEGFAVILFWLFGIG